MRTIYLVPLTVDNQCHTAEDAASCIAELVAVLQYVEPALSRTTQLYFDQAIETLCLRPNEPLAQTLSNAITDRDVIRLWYVFTRNRAVECIDRYHTATIAYGAYSCGGDISEDQIKPTSLWLGIRNPLVPTRCELVVAEPNANYTVAFISGLEATKNSLPKYEANPKHREKEYKRGGGMVVSPMVLADHEAQFILLQAIAGKRGLYARDQKSGKYYRFVKTHIDRDIFHGFEIEPEDVPTATMKMLE